MLYNEKNTNHLSGFSKLFFGEEKGVVDVATQTHPDIFDFYKLGKSIDWDENEADSKMGKDKMDIYLAPPAVRDICIMNLAYQSVPDSVANRSISIILSPFVTNSELEIWLNFQSANESLHALTYTHIVRNILEDKSIYYNQLSNENVLKRNSALLRVFAETERCSCEYRIKHINGEEVTKDDILKYKESILDYFISLYFLERLQFMDSFAPTFHIGHLGYFQGVKDLVVKIAQDEQLHSLADEYILGVMIGKNDIEKDKDFKSIYKKNKQKYQSLFDEVISLEMEWTRYLLSEGRTLTGLSIESLDDWMWYNATHIANFLGLKVSKKVNKSPLPHLSDDFNINNKQVAAMEKNVVAYSTKPIIRDDDGKIFKF